MELTKLEKVIVISAFVQGLGDEGLEKCTDKHSLEELNTALEQIVDNSAPKEMREAGASILNKFIHDLLEE
ncbi:hypothetical protein V7183_15165 [Bacillus sp. JJ1127]|uniref:hypothetical protein n=1 Tax=Bacillus sp. JJ1127 TaxID=3122952 RepID=UPI0030001FC0